MIDIRSKKPINCEHCWEAMDIFYTTYRLDHISLSTTRRQWFQNLMTDIRLITHGNIIRGEN